MRKKEEFEELIEKAAEGLKTAGHLTYVTYPVVQENRLFIKILELIGTVLRDAVNSALLYDYAFKRISLHRNFQTDFSTFVKRSGSFGIVGGEVEMIREVFSVLEKHKQAPLEFVRNDRFVIFGDNFRVNDITIEKLKKYLVGVREVVEKIEGKVKGRGF